MSQDNAYSITPYTVLSDNRLTFASKCLYGVIHSLSNGRKCTATNKYLADVLGTNIKTIQRSLDQLLDLKLINREVKNACKRELICTVRSENTHPENVPTPKIGVPPKCTKRVGQNVLTPHPENVPTPLGQNVPTDNILDTKVDTIIDKKSKKRTKFIKPTKDQIREYFTELGLNGQSESLSERFYDYYESNGWKVGRNSMKDWKATCRNWKKNQNQTQQKNETNKRNNRESHQYRTGDFDAELNARAAEWINAGKPIEELQEIVNREYEERQKKAVS